MGRPRAVISAHGQGWESDCRQAVKLHSQVSLLMLTVRQEINLQDQWQEHVSWLKAWHPSGGQGQSRDMLYCSFILKDCNDGSATIFWRWCPL